jgi:hypothetical protein
MSNYQGEAKMNSLRMKLARMVFLGTSLMTVALSAQAIESIGRVKQVQGQAEALRASDAVQLKVGDAIAESDRLVTGLDSSLGVTLNDGTLFSLGSNSDMNISKFNFAANRGSGEIAINYVKGAFRFVTGQIGKNSPKNVRIASPSATIGIRGTDFISIIGGVEEVGAVEAVGAEMPEGTCSAMPPEGVEESMMDEEEYDSMMLSSLGAAVELAQQ